jgi:hypothetical protein
MWVTEDVVPQWKSESEGPGGGSRSRGVDAASLHVAATSSTLPLVHSAKVTACDMYLHPTGGEGGGGCAASASTVY